jgi:acyl-CoA synthetase (AMP-forming)/AMP-acid ligase II
VAVAPDTLLNALRAAGDAPDAPTIVVVRRDAPDEIRTLGALWDAGRRVQGLLERHVAPAGRAVLVVLPTGAALVESWLGTLQAGALPALVAGPVHRLADAALWAARTATLAAQIDAAAILADADAAAVLAAAAPDGLPPVLVPGVTPGGTPGPVAAPSPEAVCAIQLSSGSTGRPRAVRVTHRAVVGNVEAMRVGFGIRTGEPFVNFIPLHHDMGMIGALLLPLFARCPTVLMPTTDFLREPGAWLRALSRFRGAVGWGPNAAYALCTARVPDADVATLDLAAWRLALCGSEPVLAPTIAAFTRRFAACGFRAEAFTAAWGLAENVAGTTVQRVGTPPRVERVARTPLVRDGVVVPDDGPEAVELVSVGATIPGVELAVRDAAGRPLPERFVGRVWVRSPYLFSGYAGEPAATAAALRDGWLDTGDEGFLADGELFFVARHDDVIVVGGEKHAPDDVEAAINAVPGVRIGCAVAFALPDPAAGTHCLGAVVETRLTDPAERATLAAAIRAAVARRTGLPLRRLALVPPGGVEKTTSGKLARRATRRRWAAELEAS